MSDPMQNLNDAADALNQVAARATGFWDHADAEIATRQAAYDALASNLRGVLQAEMYFNAVVDPDDANPTNTDGGTFNSIALAIETAPVGAFVELNLLPGKTYTWDTNTYVYRKSLFIRKSGVGVNPIISVQAYEDPTHNSVRSMLPRYGAYIAFFQVDVHLPTAKVNAALPWSSAKSLVAYDLFAPVAVASFGNVVTGGEGLGLMSAANGIAMLNLYSVTLDGTCFGVEGNATGTAMVTTNAVTLQNGALIHQGGTLGTNLLQK